MTANKDEERTLQAVRDIDSETLISDCNGLFIEFQFTANEDHEDGEYEVDVTISRYVSGKGGGCEKEQVLIDMGLPSFDSALAKAAELFREAARKTAVSDIQRKGNEST